ncbi:hypothetical protein EJD97_004910 [Solanum chilense]|uniref:Uncharacterized protein n=1 Tax=Solanum chilense TaxID=4083 RepID=A0A6N2BRV8_SOLCI|nr:hypothetical protein EJD97_004910 [Solanum chilense]
MDRERRKRKNLENERLEKEEEDEDEDEKIDKFFALIRSTKDIRDRLLARNQVTERSKILEENRDSVHNNSAVGIWNPSVHESRDFTVIDASAIAGPSNSNSNKQSKEVEEDETGGEREGTKKDSNDEEKKCNMLDLDLNLSL